MAKKKERERKLENDIYHTGQEIARREELIRANENAKASAEKEKEGYRSKDERVLKLTEYEKQATKVYERIKQFCECKEKEKKEQLQNAINEIFSEVFDVNIVMELDANYNMNLRNSKNSDLMDFQNSMLNTMGGSFLRKRNISNRGCNDRGKYRTGNGQGLHRSGVGEDRK